MTSDKVQKLGIFRQLAVHTKYSLIYIQNSCIIISKLDWKNQKRQCICLKIIFACVIYYLRNMHILKTKLDRNNIN